MTDKSKEQELETLAVTAATRHSKGLSTVWLVPMVALAIAGWLLFNSWAEKGPLVTITFKNAEGIDPGTSKIKYKDVEIGAVETITFSPGMTEVVVKARMDKVAAPYLTDTTRFWIVRPRIAAGQVSGLGTLFSGSYIGIDPGRTGDVRRDFQGLEEAPIVTTDNPGRYYLLKAEGLGSLDVGSPVYYRQIKVGQVVGYGFDDSGQAVDIKIFVNSPHDRQISDRTRFWNASGIDLNLDATGIKLATESLASIVSGGIAFDLPDHGQPGQMAAENAVFELYASKSVITEEKFQEKTTWLLYFNQSVRGLAIGAPVEFRGIKIGEVSSIKLDFDSGQKSFRIPVLLTIEPERIFGKETEAVLQKNGGQAMLKDFVGRGLRAVLKNGNLLTGQLLVDFDFYADAQPQKLVYEESYPVLPTRQTELQQITESLTSLLDKVERIPFGQISADLHETLQAARQTIDQFPVRDLSQELQATMRTASDAMRQIDTLAANFNSRTTPAITQALEQLSATLAEMESSLGNDSPANYQLRQTMREMSMAVRSMRGLTDYLERHPESLLYGKEKEQP
jgi:paraquat-inducible protein B